MTLPYDFADQHLRKGVWTVRLNATATDAPAFKAYCGQDGIDGLDVARVDGGWRITVPCPATLVSDGAHVLMLQDASTGDTIATTTIVAGRPLDRDLLSEIDLLRAELGVLKRAFRTHCAATRTD